MHRFIATVKFFRKLLFLYFFFRFCDRRNEIMGGNFALAHACITHAQTRIEIWFYVSHVNVKKMCFSEFGASGSHRTEWNVVMMFAAMCSTVRSPRIPMGCGPIGIFHVDDVCALCTIDEHGCTRSPTIHIAWAAMMRRWKPQKNEQKWKKTRSNQIFTCSTESSSFVYVLR